MVAGAAKRRKDKEKSEILASRVAGVRRAGDWELGTISQQRRWRSFPPPPLTNYFNSVRLPGQWPLPGFLAWTWPTSRMPDAKQNAGLELDTDPAARLLLQWQLQLTRSAGCSQAKQQRPDGVLCGRWVQQRPAVATPDGWTTFSMPVPGLEQLFPWCCGAPRGRTVSDTAPTPRTWPSE